MLKTSLKEIQSYNPCSSCWGDILAGQGKTEADDVLFPLEDCLKSNSISEVLWLIGQRKVEIQIAVSFAKACAEFAAEYKDCSDDAAARAARAADYAAGAARAATYATYASGAADYVTYAARAADYATLAAVHGAAHVKLKSLLVQCIQDFSKA